MSAKKRGFGSPTKKKSSGAVVPTPEGGWPEVSVIVVGPEGKASRLVALQQLAAQDYPIDQVKEILVFGADSLRDSAPANIKALLKEHASTGDFQLREEFAACTGEVVAVWGDDHISSPERLRAQVAASAGASQATVLQASWYYDADDATFMKVTKWPHTDAPEEPDAKQNLPDFIDIMVRGDPLTLCGSRQVLAEVAGQVQDSTPSESLKELLYGLQSKTTVKVMDDVQWAAVRSPPAVMMYETATPEASLTQIAKEAWILEDNTAAPFALAKTLEEIEAERLAPAAAIDRILGKNAKTPLTQANQKKLHQAVFELLSDASGAETAAVISNLQDWYGLRPGGSDDKAVRNFPTFYAIFSAVRSHVQEDADLFEMNSLGHIANGLVTLAQKIWAVDEKVNEVLAGLLIADVTATHEGTDRGMVTADTVGTLGLRDCLETIARVGTYSETADVDVSSLVVLARALSEVGIESNALQLKVAKGIINGSDKLTPPDIGNLWVTMHEKKWFKDDQTVKYLTESMLRRAQELKRNDAGLAQALAAQQS